MSRKLLFVQRFQTDPPRIPLNGTDTGARPCPVRGARTSRSRISIRAGRKPRPRARGVSRRAGCAADCRSRRSRPGCGSPASIARMAEWDVSRAESEAAIRLADAHRRGRPRRRGDERRGRRAADQGFYEEADALGRRGDRTRAVGARSRHHAAEPRAQRRGAARLRAVGRAISPSRSTRSASANYEIGLAVALDQRGKGRARSRRRRAGARGRRRGDRARAAAQRCSTFCSPRSRTRPRRSSRSATSTRPNRCSPRRSDISRARGIGFARRSASRSWVT